jgi:hypothetical protein
MAFICDGVTAVHSRRKGLRFYGRIVGKTQLNQNIH